MSKQDLRFTWHYDHKDTFDPPPSDQPVTVYADPGPTQPSDDECICYFGKERGAAGLRMTPNARNYTLILQPPASDHPIFTAWYGQEPALTIESGTVFYDSSLNKSSLFVIDNASPITIGEGGRLRIGALEGGDIHYSDDFSEAQGRIFTLSHDGSFEVEVNDGSASHESNFILSDTARMTTSGRGVVFHNATFTLKDSAKLTATGRADNLLIFENKTSISLQDQSVVEIYSDEPFFDSSRGSSFTLNNASATLSFFPLTKTADPFDFGKNRYPKALFNFIKDQDHFNQSRVFIPGMELRAACLRQAMLQDQVLAINGTITQDSELIDHKTETINTPHGPCYGTWIFLRKKP